MNQNNQQNQNKVGNPETQIAKTPQMNERDFVNDILSQEKYLTAGYATALNELSHDSLYKDIQGIFNETQNCQREMYNLMFKYGWYKLEAAEPQKLQQAYQQFTNYRNQQSPFSGGMTQ